MAGINDTLLNTLDRTIVEDFGNSIVEANFDIDPWSQNLVQNSMGVTREGLAWQYMGSAGPQTTKNAWTKVMVFRTGLGGAASWRSVNGNAPTITADDSQFMVYGASAPQTFPGLDEITAPTYLQSAATLKEMYGSFAMPLELLRADQSNKNIASQIGAIISESAKRVALREINAFWGLAADSGGASAGAYLTFTIPTTTLTVTTTTITNGPISAATHSVSRYELARLQNGETVDIYKADGTRMNGSTQPVFVTQIDPLNLTFQLVRTSGSNISLTAATYYLFPYNSYGSQPTSINQVLVANPGTASTTYVYGIDVYKYPQFASMVKALSGGETTLTEAVLNKYVGGFLVAKPMQGRIDTLVTTPGVKTKYVNNQVYVGRRDRYSVPVRLGEGFSKPFDYEWDGTRMSVDTSAFCPSGTLYGLRLRGGNFQKLTPPAIPGSGSDARFGSYVEFIGNITGTSIFVPSRSSTAQFTDFAEAPFKRHLEYVCEYVCGLKLTGLDEDIATY